MEEQKNGMKGKTCPCGCEGCTCGGYGHWGWHGRHSMWRIVIGLLMVIFIFWVGVKVGEIKAIFGGYGWNGYGRHGYMMGAWDGYGYGGYAAPATNGTYGAPMMRYYYPPQTATSTTSAK